MADPTRNVQGKPRRLVPRVKLPEKPTLSVAEFRDWLAQEVRARGGQVAAARQLGVAQTTLSQILRGRFLPGHVVCLRVGLRRVDVDPVFEVAR